MPLGPVFQVELLTTARRARFFLLRTLYGLLLLGLVAQFYYDRTRTAWSTGSGLSIREMAEFGAGIFRTFAICQAAVILLITPALVAGVVADERQRKTLHYLLASRLTSPEIVLGKLAARLILLSVLLMLGLPILSLLGLLGGVQPELVAWSYAGTASTMLLLAALSIFVSSVVARRVRDAILVVYVLEIAWLILPVIFLEIGSRQWPIVHEFVGPPLEWLVASGPAALFRVGGGTTLLDTLGQMIALQLGAALVLIVAAVLGLRPAYRREGRLPGFFGGLFRARGPRRRLFARASCGDDPMLWKETHVGRMKGSVRFVVAGVGLIIIGLTIYGTYESGRSAWAEFLETGLAVPDIYTSRDSFNAYLRMVGFLLYSLTGLIVAVAAASSLTSEREEDTWISLVSTTLTGREIVLSKIFGAVWGARRMILLILAVWTSGLVVGAIHPYGFLLCVGQLLVFLSFAACLGAFVSLGARTTTRSLAMTVGILFFLNAGYLLILIFFQPDSPLIAAGSTPYVLVVSLFSYRDVWQFLGWLDNGWSFFGNSPDDRWANLGLCLLSPALYGMAAVVLGWLAVVRFDAVVDRPSLDRDQAAPVGLNAMASPAPSPASA